ncbi:unnamed protein product [Medioppia subpectinata]|uniref:Frizzled/Smoothened 7TM domain-containing protein n=1 Tax=Medioppia subpectinata TaxID=1979941 RepID=A0A7R9KX47_9ACAR|nr:unnamed protein product [Medioppia subpectinata]CAG2111456.1 unnamed protein product [Medioppia subpectinata]
MRICFVLVPMTISVTIGCYYMFKSMLTLIKVKLINRTRSNSNRSKSKKIEHMIIRIGLYVLSSVIGLIVTYVSHIYEFTHSSQWRTSLNDYIMYAYHTCAPTIVCTLNMTAALGQPMGYQSTEGVGGTTLAETDSAVASLTVIFGAAVCTSSWVWTGNSLRGWRRFMKRHLKPDHTYPIRIKPHETIAKTYGRRNQLSQGCYSPSFQSMHSDPVAMNLNSAVSQDLSATFAGALPNLMYRRGAVAGDRSTDAATIAGQNHYLPNFVGTRHSSNSDVSQQQSYDSYRRSLDSQYSIEMVAMDRHKHRKTRKEREKLLKPKGNPHHHRRRGSDTSGSVISTALAVRAFQKAAKSECKSTSTRDLMQLPLSPLPHTLLPQLTPQLIANPFMTPPICSPAGFAMPVPSAQSSHSTLSFMPPTIPPFIRPKVKPNPNASTSFTFTHGMSDQSSHLINPLLEKRRPDSCLPPGGHPLPSNSSLTVQQSLNTTPNGSVQPVGNNLGLQYAPSANYGMPFMANNGMPFMAPNPQSLNYYTQPMNAAFGYGNLLVNSQTGQSFPNYTPFGPSPLPQPGLPFPAYPAFPPYPSAAQPLPPQQPQQCANIQDVQELMRQREAFLSICLPHRRSDTASEPDANYLNIVLSDSEGIYSPDPGSRNEGLITAQQLVDEHIQRVEAAAAANTSSALAPVAGNSGHNETIVGALGGQGLDMESNGLMEPKASKSESKRRNKKKAAKKHKNSNGTAGATAAVHNSANNSNNNNNANDVKDNECDEQNPLMGGADTAGADDEPNH